MSCPPVYSYRNMCPRSLPSSTAGSGLGSCSTRCSPQARIVMGRRGKKFTETEEQLYRGLYEQTRLERERAFQKNPQPTAQRSREKIQRIPNLRRNGAAKKYNDPTHS